MEEMKKTLFFAIEAGKMLLENGAETYRVEDTMQYILNSRGIMNMESFVIPTGIFIAARKEDDVFSYVVRVYSISTDLRKITRINELSRDFVASKMTTERAMARLDHIKKTRSYSVSRRYVLGGAGAAFTAILFGGTFVDFAFSMLVSIMTLASLDAVKKQMDSFIINIVGGFVAAMSAFMIAEIVYSLNIPLVMDTNKAIIGALMTMVPGVAITNAVRDSISGDYVSGMSRTTDAIVTALSIALGVGIAMKITLLVFGRI